MQKIDCVSGNLVSWLGLEASQVFGSHRFGNHLEEYFTKALNMQKKNNKVSDSCLIQMNSRTLNED